MKKLLARIVSHLSLIYKVAAILVTSVLILLMFPNKDRSQRHSYSVGSFWTEDDLYAPCDFAVKKSDEAIAREKMSARQASLLFFTTDSSAYTTAKLRLDKSDMNWQDKRAAARVLEYVYRKGLIEIPADYGDMTQHTIVVLHGNVGSEHNFLDFVSPQQLEEWVEYCHWGSTGDEIERNAQMLRDEIVVPSVRFDNTRTQLELDSRLSQINYASRMLQQGELVIAKGEYIDEEKGLMLESLDQERSGQLEEHYHPFVHSLGQLLLCLIAFTALFMFLKIIRHSILDDDKKVTFVLVTVLFMAGIVALVERINPNWVLLAPICIVPILMRVFFDMRVALYIDLTVVIILGSLVPNSFEFIFYQLITGMMSIITVKNFDRRSDFFVVALSIFLTYSLIYTAGILSQDTSLANISGQRYMMFFLNALLTLLSYPLIYLFEKIFGITTVLTLMEISSTNTPALRELSRKAPGTFQHSMQVANISEDIINEIGGNALLARVGALYHDIGKTLAPLNFTENQNSNFNPHDELDYEESARLITRHVRDGIDLAKKYRLPGDVTDFIRTHHGTTKTGYFYAMWQAAHPGEEPDLMAFKYAGPCPFSRETAVVMIVDSVEAATKSIKEPTREAIAQMVNNIIDGKIREKQLDYCSITFGDITKIRELLIKKITSVYHVRVSYPTANKK